jgi:hypothetical protein
MVLTSDLISNLTIGAAEWVYDETDDPVLSVLAGAVTFGTTLYMDYELERYLRSKREQ